MRSITLRPNLKTAGGEASDIHLQGRFVGSLLIVYREQDRVLGAVQLEKDSLRKADKDEVLSFIEDHMLSFVDAVGAVSHETFVTYSRYERIVTSELEMEDDSELFAEESDIDYETDEEWDGGTVYDSVEYDLVLVNEKKNRAHYHVYLEDGTWIAESFLHRGNSDVSGQVRWVVEPTDDQIEEITELLVSEFDENVVDTLVIDHHFDGDLIETIELTHEDLLDTPMEIIGEQSEYEYNVILARDDGDVLTYEIYDPSERLPIGTATVDIRHRRLTGYIDFRSRKTIDDAGAIASQLMRELDKEKDYDGLNLSLMYKNERIDELIFENEPVH